MKVTDHRLKEAFHSETPATYKRCLTASVWVQTSLCRRLVFISGSLGNVRQSPVWGLQMAGMPHMPMPDLLFIFRTAGHSSGSWLVGWGWLLSQNLRGQWVGGELKRCRVWQRGHRGKIPCPHSTVLSHLIWGVWVPQQQTTSSTSDVQDRRSFTHIHSILSMFLNIK